MSKTGVNPTTTATTVSVARSAQNSHFVNLAAATASTNVGASRLLSQVCRFQSFTIL